MDLLDSVTRATVILETSPMKKRFDSETLAFFQELFSWRRPKKFKFNNGTFKFVRGRVTLFRGRHRCLQFYFNNGYIWIASISKLAPKDVIREARNKATEYLDREYYGLYEEVA